MKKGVFAMLVLGAIAAAGAAGCVGGGKGLSAEDKEKLAPYILDTVPADTPHKVDINFENKVHVVGYKFEPEVAKPGQEIKLIYYWRCDDTVENGWQLFTHVQVDGSEKPDNLDWSGPIRQEKDKKQILGPDRWEKGKVYVDEQTYTVPASPSGPEATVFVGIWKGDARLRVISGPNDGDNRAIIGKFKTGVAKVEEPKKTMNDVPMIMVGKLAANDKITIDGKGDEKAWGGAASTGPFVDVGTGKPNTSFPVKGSAKMLWDDNNLYVLIEAQDPDLVGYFTDAKSQPKDWTATGQPMLWTKHTVEMMVDPGPEGDNINYYELQINPQNKVFKSQFDTYNAPKGAAENGPFGHEDWDPGLKSAVVTKGTIDKHDDKDDGYTVEIQIPWKAYAKAAKQIPPKHGDTWRMNFYAMQDNGGVAWSPILGQGNFHRASRFGKVMFVVPGQPLPGAVGDGGAPEGGAGDGGATAAAAGEGGAPLTLDQIFGDGGRRPRMHLPRPATPPPQP
jgi:hypothetical protein